MSEENKPLKIMPAGQEFESMNPPEGGPESEEEETVNASDRCLIKNHIPGPTDRLFDNIYDIVSTSYFDPKTDRLLSTPALGVTRRVKLGQKGVIKYDNIDIDQIKRLPWWAGLSFGRLAFKVFNKGTEGEHRKDIATFCQMWWTDDGRQPWALVKWKGQIDGESELVNWDELEVEHPSEEELQRRRMMILMSGK